MSHFLPVDEKLFFTKNDPNDPRLGDLVNRTSIDDSHTVFYLGGFPDDEGVLQNGGRTGASKGPDSIRNRLYRMTPPPFQEFPPDQFQLFDVGNLNCAEPSLQKRHEQAADKAFEALGSSDNSRWIGLGGGHDYGFPDGDAFMRHALSGTKRPVVINFDAHLDVRPLKEGNVISSGTPFFRLLEKYPGQFDFLEVGLQPYCNSRSHFQWLLERGGKALTMEQIRSSHRNLSELIFDELGEGQNRPCFLSVDIDAFSSSVAPGCSQSWPGGLMPHEYFPSMKALCNNFHVSTLGIYEVSPPLDQDEQTAKLAAEIIYQFLFPSK